MSLIPSLDIWMMWSCNYQSIRENESSMIQAFIYFEYWFKSIYVNLLFHYIVKGIWTADSNSSFNGGASIDKKNSHN